MPELPEVEIVRRGLEPVLCGHRIVRVEQRRADLRFKLPDRLAERLEGRTVLRILRRAKYLLAYLDGGEVLVMHLGMTGRFLVAPDGVKSNGAMIGTYEHETGTLPQHDHVLIHTSAGRTVTYNDPRRFGFMLLLAEAEVDSHPLFSALGIEPLGNGLSADTLAARARGRRTDLKAFLMDQRQLAGLGNIYVCEALFRARLLPRRPAASLALASGKASKRAIALVPAIRSVLDDALAAGGSTLRDYRQADGRPGEFQHAHLVYGREGEPCLRSGCSGMVRRIIQAGRSTFYCPACQR